LGVIFDGLPGELVLTTSRATASWAVVHLV